jgi:hypothetical protein
VKFGRRQQPADAESAANPYLGLRSQFLGLGSEQVDAPLRGVALEIGMSGGVATVVCVADGTTSMYTSGGGGYIGMGRHEAVRQANAAFRNAVGDRLDTLAPVDEVPLPGAGEVNVVAVTVDGLRLLHCTEAQARDATSPAYPLYVAGQIVVTQLRLVAEAQQR